MLKIIRSSDKSAPGRNNGSRLTSCSNNNSKPVSEKNNRDDEDDRFGIGSNGIESARKSKKSKGEKSAKSQKLYKLGKSKSEKSAKSKNLSKSGNLFNSGTTGAKLNFITLGARETFSYLWLAFINALIL